MYLCRVPTAQGKWQKIDKSLTGKTQGIWKFCQNTENLSPILNFLILKIKCIELFAVKFPIALELNVSAKSVLPIELPQITENWHTENLQMDSENTKNLKTEFEWGPSLQQKHKRSENLIQFMFVQQNCTTHLCYVIPLAVTKIRSCLRQ